MSESTKSGIIRSIVLMVFAAIVILGVFMLFTRRGSNTNTTTEEETLTEVQKITTIDLKKTYPQTPPTVVDLYARTMKVLYKESYTDEEFAKMADVMSGIFDSEFLAVQQNWPSGLKSEVEQKRKDDFSIPKYEVLTSDLQEKRDNGEEIANVVAKIHLRHGTHTTPYNYLFVLRKDSEGLWKIMGWTISEETSTGN
ncbi:DUF6715 family protein [Butyrivibrio sp. AC2005]|uniref:DUF6715 family protein n=1 Tax=Butyrivibrio sp. AC2005 TaxID=1280672 RepID=UPI00041A75FC|nr:DUF6715 family protein [Butyrivibrio sp. AC2005]